MSSLRIVRHDVRLWQKLYIAFLGDEIKEDEARKFKMFKHFPTPMYLPLTPRMRLKRPEIVAVCEY